MLHLQTGAILVNDIANGMLGCRCRIITYIMVMAYASILFACMYTWEEEQCSCFD